MIKLPPEKLGSFYLGAKYDIENKKLLQESINYDARDLTTHAVCVGMTGSGKTGLCIGLLEEAAIDKVPAIIIDPKGDMTNLLLQFENLQADEFKKWINPDDASRKGLSIDEYAVATAKKWKDGLSSWGQDKSRIKNLKNAVEYTIYTPGSNAGIPINILGSFAAPKVNFEDDAEMLRERIQGTVAALLGMVQIKADPVRSREGILLATLFEHYWRQNEDLDLVKLITGIQKPPIQKLGVFDVDTFFPEKDRFDLAMSFNTLMASPQFSYWLQGEDLDIEKIYFTPEGKPRHSIFYIAHLSDSERMFFVTLLLNSLVSWMRRQSGTSSLRSLIYFDEIFGYFPPTAEPPSKKPLLTILKQARAYGVGAVLVTQNPVDIDYKGLSNAGTWFIGKLQTERDKARVLEGLEGAIATAGGSNKADFSSIISSLSSRVFLMHNVHEDQPVIYNTRWVMSYLRGPLTRPQVKELMADKKELSKQKSNPIKASYSVQKEEEPDLSDNPQLDPAIIQRFLPVRKTKSETALDNPKLQYRAQSLVSSKVRFYDRKRNIDKIETVSYLCPAPDDFGRIDWEASKKVNNWEDVLSIDPIYPQGELISFAKVPGSLNSPKEIEKAKKEYSNWLYQNQKFTIHELEKYKLYQDEQESNEAFQMRVQQHAREFRDQEIEELTEKYDVKLDKIEDKIRKEENDLAEAEADAKDRNNAKWLGVAETIFSVLVKKRSRSMGSAASKSRMALKAKQRVESSIDDLQELEEDFEDLKIELEDKVETIRSNWDNVASNIIAREISPRKTDIKVDAMILTWYPYWVDNQGNIESALA